MPERSDDAPQFSGLRGMSRLAKRRAVPLWRGAVALSLLLALIVPLLPQALPAGASASGIVISEFRFRGPSGGNDEFIELFNASAASVSIAGWKLEACSATGGTRGVRATIPTGVTLAAGQHYLFTNSASGGYSGSVTGDQQYSTGVSDNAGAPSGALISDSAGNVIDGVGATSMTASACKEGTTGLVFPTANAEATFVRLNSGCTDTDDNAADFASSATAGPQNTSSTATPCSSTPSPSGSPSSTPSPTASPSASPGTRIHDIQGAAHISPLRNTAVTNVPGIVTGLRSNGFYLQDPTPDSDPATSEGILVFTSSAPTVAVGNALLVSGTVTEFRAGTGGDVAGNPGLTVTEITAPTITLVSAVNPLPEPIVIGAGGRVPPTTVIEDDATGTPASVEDAGSTFDPANDGIDFYESLEGMRVQVNGAVAVGPTSDFGSNREIAVVPGGGSGVGLRTPRGGVVIQPGDFNPERIILNDLIRTVPTARDIVLPLVNVGDGLGDVTGVIDYAFNNFKLEVTAAPTRTDGGTQRETTAVTHTANGLTIATFNVENLDPGDGNTKFGNLAGEIVTNLGSPDIIAVEEIQDNNGATNDGLVDANQTFALLIAAIQAAGGPTYQYRQINPTDDQDGGEPGGNIRVGFLFNPASGVTFVDRAGGCAVCAVSVVGTGAATQLSYSPGRIDPTNPAFNSSRKPLAGEFRFNGRQLFVIANHFNSKGGDQPLFGRYQPPTLSSETQRLQQAQIVHDFVQSILTADANANVVVLGDINDFQFSKVAGVLMHGDPTNVAPGGTLTSLLLTLPPNEQYSYVFDGNSQTLDQILVSPALYAQFGAATAAYDVVHVNAEFYDQISDHDPQVARFTLVPPPPTAANLAVATPEDTAIQISLGGAASNGGGLTYTIVGGPSHGSLGQVVGGQVTYTPAANYNGPDSFTYKVSENGLDSGTATVTITVGAVNDPPVAAGATVSTPEDTGIEISLGATDVEGSTLTYTIVTGPSQGSLGTLNGNKVVYMPAGEYGGPDSFTFKANDGATDSNVATITITVAPVNDPPTALNGTATVAEDGSVVVTLAGTDVEGATLTYGVVNGPAHGTVGAVSGNQVAYTPAANFNGTDSFTFRVNDGANNSPAAIVTITVTPINDAPVATDGAATTGNGVAVQVVLGVSDAEGDPLTYSIVAGPAHGTLGAIVGNRVVYTPTGSYSGADSFTFRANDGKADSNVATVSLSVGAAPTFTLTVSMTGNGAVTPGTGPVAAGTTVMLTAAPAGGALFVGWTVDNNFAGFKNPLPLTMNANHTVVAAFAPRPSFSDVNGGTPYTDAIARLAARGIIKGFGDGSFGPEKRIKRAEAAALIARAMGWDQEDHGNAFPDRCDPSNPSDCIDADLWRNVGTLAFYDVARGYPGGLYNPRDEVAQVQVVSFIARAMVARGYWVQATADDPTIYPNVTPESGHRLDLVTFVRNAGAVPGRPANQAWGDWQAPALRGWVAGVLDQALGSRFATVP